MRGNTVGILAICMCWGAALAQVSIDNTPDWQKAAGREAFDVASIREDKGDFKDPSFALSTDDSFEDPKGRFHADFGLLTYIEFAYKIDLTREEERTVLSKLPAWVGTDRFEIQATAPLNESKDQYRVMMQELLARRFALQLHFEQKDMPVLAMVLAKPGQPGPKLKPHSQGPACSQEAQPGVFPATCYIYEATDTEKGLALFGSRSTPTSRLASFLGRTVGSFGQTGRPVLDGTGLTGLWDFTLEVAQIPGGVVPLPTQDTGGPSLLEALQEQLGVKLKPTRAMVSLPVVDHVSRPSEN